jgi:predicted ATPase/DNA-binding winged helix-turn-helix (wHTH) protein
MVNEILWRGSKKVHLRPKTLALLRYLCESSGRLVTNKELMADLWHDSHVGDYVLKSAIVEIRKALGDDVNEPRFVETVHRRGYRFVGKINDQQAVNRGKWEKGKRQKLQPAIRHAQPVGRELELDLMQSWLEKSLGWEQQVVFVTGEQGIGKTTLVDSFLDILDFSLPTNSPPLNPHTGTSKFRVCVARGQCIESHGAIEAYMPILEAFTRLCKESMGVQVLAALNEHAPLWLTQMPSLVSADKLISLQQITLGATPARMLREIAEVIEALSTELPLVLVLEDLHWSDYSTLDLISYLAQRRAPVRLLVVATFCPEEVIGTDHPLLAIKNMLQAYRQCQELPLMPLDEAAVVEYLMRRFPEHEFPMELGVWIQQQTNGNPLFMVNLVDHLVAQGHIIQQNEKCILIAPLKAMELAVPTTLQQMIKRQIERCSLEEQRVLEAGSVEGTEFCTSAVATALNEKARKVEELCDGLARRLRFLRSEGHRQLSNGELTSRYKFTHALYRSVCYTGLTEARQIELHRRVGEHIEGKYVNYLGNISPKLATHFERAREYRQAIEYYRQAAGNANGQYAYGDAIELARKGLQLLEMSQDNAERAHQELKLQIELGIAMMAIRGFGAVEMKQAFLRARELCRQLSEERLLFSALFGLWRGCRTRAECQVARELAEQMVQLEQSEQHSMLQAQAYYALGATLLDQGEFAPALEYLKQGFASQGFQEQDSHFHSFKNDPGLTCRCYAALAKWILGLPDQALRDINEVLALASEPYQVENFISGRHFAAVIYQLRRESKQALKCAEEALAYARRYELVQWTALLTTICAWARAKQGELSEGIKQLRQEITAHSAIGSISSRSISSSLLAELLGEAGNIKEGLTTIKEALALTQSTGVRYYESELHRIKGELMLQESEMKLQEKGDNKLHSYAGNLRSEEAEACFYKAIDVARRQRAKIYELRATTSLASLWQKQNRQAEARERLAEVYKSFTEGHNTKDLQEAHTLLQQLS